MCFMLIVSARSNWVSLFFMYSLHRSRSHVAVLSTFVLQRLIRLIRWNCNIFIASLVFHVEKFFLTVKIKIESDLELKQRKKVSNKFSSYFQIRNVLWFLLAKMNMRNSKKKKISKKLFPSWSATHRNEHIQFNVRAYCSFCMNFIDMKEVCIKKVWSIQQMRNFSMCSLSI